MGNSFPAFFLPTTAIFAILIVSILIFSLWHRHRTFSRPSDPETLQREIEKTDTSQGEQVWFSRQVHRGRWRHWSLIIRNRRYELRAGDAQKGEPAYVFEHGTCSLAYERQLADKDGAALGLGSYRGFYVCLVGWTRRNHEQIVALGEKVMERMAAEAEIAAAARAAVASRAGTRLVGDEEQGMLAQPDAPFEKSCQAFLKGLSERVLEHRKAADWSWFRENVTTGYQDVGAKLMAGPGRGERSTTPGPMGWGGRARSLFRPPMASVDAGVRAWAYG